MTCGLRADCFETRIIFRPNVVLSMGLGLPYLTVYYNCVIVYEMKYFMYFILLSFIQYMCQLVYDNLKLLTHAMLKTFKCIVFFQFNIS